MSDNSMLNALKGTIPPDAMPFGIGGPAEPTVESGAPGMVGSVLHGLFNIPKHLIDASANAVPGLRKEDVTDNPNAPEPNQPMYNAAAETALNLAGIGMPMAEAGAAGSFGGELSRTANLRKLDQAKRMTDKGQKEDMIRQLTGWERGPEGLWRYEIPDNGSRMSYLNANGPAASMFQHPELFKAYPNLKDLRMFSEVNPNFPSNTGLWNLNDLTVQLSSQNPHQARLGALHELQHAIQHTEGFTPGGNVPMFEEMLKSPKAKALAGDKDAFALYDHTAGEVEARNVERRADYNANMRQQFGPQITQDYPYAHQIRLKPIADHPMLKVLREGLSKP